MNGARVPLGAIRRAAEEKDRLVRAARTLCGPGRTQCGLKLCAAMLCLCLSVLIPLHGAAAGTYIL